MLTEVPVIVIPIGALYSAPVPVTVTSVIEPDILLFAVAVAKVVLEPVNAITGSKNPFPGLSITTLTMLPAVCFTLLSSSVKIVLSQVVKVAVEYPVATFCIFGINCIALPTPST